MLRLFAPAILLLTALAGCLSDVDGDGPGASPGAWPLLAGPALWDDPQNTPHPAYGWATLSSPPEGLLPQWWQPIQGAGLPQPVAGFEHVAAAPEGIGSGAGIAQFGSLLFVPGFSSESYVVDVSDPTAPVLLSTLEDLGGAHRGAAFIAYPDGRLIVTASTGSGFDVVDVTDPFAPVLLVSEQVQQRGHKVGIVPGTPILYNAGSFGGSSSGLAGEGHVDQLAGRGTEIYDLTDPAAPQFVQFFENGYSCHHIYFWNNPAQDKYRAICAGHEHTQIWDTADPLDPQVIVSVPVHHGVVGVPAVSVFPVLWSHFAGLSRDGTVLLVGDETFIGQASCGASLSSPLGGDLSMPLGALWFYDISDETDPLLQGWFNPGHQLPDAYDLCTAHHGRLVPDPARDLIAMAFYGAGVVLVDFTDPTAPFLVDHFDDGTDTWEVWYNQGYLFTGDLSRGMDVLRIT